MCGRYAAFLPPDELRRVFATVNPLPNIGPNWNVAPTHMAPVVRLHPRERQRHLDPLRWGLVPYRAKDVKSARQPINARAESAADSRLFRDALAARRCLVPADAFYEWQAAPGGKQPYAIARADGQPMALAGLWESWRAPDGSLLRSYVILTTEASEALRALHERMPVILEPEDWPLWLGEVAGDYLALLRPSRAALRVWPVGQAVNNVRNEGAELLKPA